MGAILDFFLNEKKGGTEGEEPKNKQDSKETDPDMKEGEDTNADDFGGEDKDGDGDIDDDDLFNDVDKEADANDDSTEDSNNNNNDNSDLEESNDDDLNTNDDQDDTSSIDDSSTDDTDTDDINNDDNQDNDSSTDESQSEDDNDETTKKNLLKKSFSILYSDINVLIDKINSAIDYDDEIESFTLSNLSNNLKRSQSLVYDYVLNLFDKKEYAENLYIYYSILDTVKLSKEIISKIVEKRNKD